MWWSKKLPQPSKLPIINVYAPTFCKDQKGNTISVGLDKTNNTLWYCSTHPGDPSKPILPHLVEAHPIQWIKKKPSGAGSGVRGGVLICVDYPHRPNHILEFEPLGSGEVYFSSPCCRSLLTPERELFIHQGHAEFDLLECLFQQP